MRSLPKILIIDDEELVRLTLEGLFASWEVELLFAENGEEGLKMAQEFQPDAILLDVMMPGMDGYETCRRIRTNPSLAEIPIIMITALDDREARLTGLQAGADDFLPKPFDSLEIQIRIRNIMRINRYRNLMAERSRFLWVVDNDSNGYVLLAENGNILYANPRAQVYLHLPESYSNINFTRQSEHYYQPHVAGQGGDLTSEGPGYLVQPESPTSRAFWLKVDLMKPRFEVGDQRLVRLTDITDEMSNRQDVRKLHKFVAHKLRTPVFHISSSIAIINEMDTLNSDAVKSMIQIAQQGAERLLKEVQDIIEYMEAPKTLAGGTPLELEGFTKIVQTVSELLELKDVSISMADHLVNCQLSFSGKSMELLLFEILENSKKFHPHQKPLIQIRVEAHDGHGLQFQFLDDGQGMTPEQIIQAKLPYSQGEKWFTGEISGMGLGIPLVSTLIWQAGGQLRLANRDDGAGICVTITLPLATPPV